MTKRNIEPNIVLIEDNPDDSEALIRGLRSVGCKFSVEWFTESEDALQYISERPSNMTQLLIIDLNLPGLDGRALIKYIRANKAIRGIPILIFTTSSDNKDIQYCYEHGANAYIQKPVNFEKMKN